jgi:hypothetical protein
MPLPQVRGQTPKDRIEKSSRNDAGVVARNQQSKEDIQVRIRHCHFLMQTVCDDWKLCILSTCMMYG